MSTDTFPTLAEYRHPGAAARAKELRAKYGLPEPDPKQTGAVDPTTDFPGDQKGGPGNA